MCNLYNIYDGRQTFQFAHKSDDSFVGLKEYIHNNGSNIVIGALALISSFAFLQHSKRFEKKGEHENDLGELRIRMFCCRQQKHERKENS